MVSAADHRYWNVITYRRDEDENIHRVRGYEHLLQWLSYPGFRIPYYKSQNQLTNHFVVKTAALTANGLPQQTVFESSYFELTNMAQSLMCQWKATSAVPATALSCTYLVVRVTRKLGGKEWTVSLSDISRGPLLHADTGTTQYSLCLQAVPVTALSLYSLFQCVPEEKKNSVAWVNERTIPTERQPLVGKVSANFCGQRVPRSQRDESLRTYSRVSRPEPLLLSQVTPQLYSLGWVDSVPDPLLLRKSSSVQNRSRTSGSVAGNSDH
jgi:hypothetical protein